MPISDFNFDLPFPDVFPKEWKDEMGKLKFMSFRNLEHFKFEVSKLTQKADKNCDMTYEKALSMLLNGESDFPKEEQDSIRNLVRSNLLKRGLITQEVYENFRYSTDGTKVDVDVGKYANGEPDCVITPAVQYVDFFYELYINISYPWNISNEKIRTNIAKLLATIEELERQHIFIKISLVLPIHGVSKESSVRDYFSFIPLFSHKEMKSVSTMSSVVNDRLLRKFYFALLEATYGENLSYGYGTAVKLPKTMNPGEDFNEIEFFEEVKTLVGA